MTEDTIVVDKKYIPLDKSWIIRMGILDMVNEHDDVQNFLATQENLGDDLLALKKASGRWKFDKDIDVGESGTLYRLLKYVSWKQELHKKFILQETLKHRKINDDQIVIRLSQTELLKYDNGTSQWASAAVLLGDPERIYNPPFKLDLTYKAVEHWQMQKDKGLSWQPRHDETILRQAETYLKLLNGEKPDFIPEQAEDFCFAYIFGYITAQEGEKSWPALRGHESNRIVEIQETFKAAKEGEKIISKDHRVVQAVAMWGKVNKKELNIIYPQSVNKSWPQFWDFLNS
ncbi:MAG: hypothetical protein V4664_04035 [Patescibacteria group bacterium]